MKLAICNELFEKWELENIISYCAELGYDGIEIAPFTLGEWPNKLPLQKRDALRNFAANQKIELIGLHWLLAGPAGLSVSSPDAAVREFTQQYLIDLIHLCADLGGRIMVFGSPKQRSVSPGQTFEQVWNYAVRLFANCMETAEARGVTICFEPLSPKETNFINTAASGIRLIQAVDHPAFKLHLDVKAMSYENKPIPQIIEDSREFLGHFHVNDQEGHEPGYGTLDFKPILEKLREIEYNGYVSVEAFDFHDGAEIIANRAYTYLSAII